MFRNTLAASALAVALGATPAAAQYYYPYDTGCYDDWGNSIPCYDYGFYGGPFFGFGGPFFFGDRHFRHGFHHGFFVNRGPVNRGFVGRRFVGHPGFAGQPFMDHGFVGRPMMSQGFVGHPGFAGQPFMGHSFAGGFHGGMAGGGMHMGGFGGGHFRR
jgi:hypothetical protein